MLRVGLTGGIACGKSQVLARLAAHGFATLDLDRVAHAVIEPGGPAYDEVVAAFGPAIVSADGRIERARLGAIVFSDPEARERLNAAVHPHVRQEEARLARELAGSARVLVTDAALLVESGLHLRFDRLVVVECAAEQQLARLMARDGLGEGAAHARIAAQMPVGEKRRFAHFVIDSSGSHADTAEAVARAAADLDALAALPPVPWRPSLEQAAGVLLDAPPRGPRGIEPARLLELVAECGGLELARAARLLDPPAGGPWHRAARPSEPPPGPETLAGVVALWALSRARLDPEFLAAAAFSLAWLTHRDAGQIAGACFAALAVQSGLLGGARPRVEDARALAERWGGGPVPDVLLAEWPRQLERARTPAGDVPAKLAASLGRLFAGAH